MDIVVRVRGACKSYGSGKAATKVLDHLDMTVLRGNIYGLLGASGCGKTTLLNCIVGRWDLDSGEITILGGKPGRKSCVARIGHMPQEVALVGEFTVRDAINYFGWIFGMPNNDIKERFQFLSSLLDLPPEDCLLKNLSGGQQRRVSLAAALVHKPQLLILDEPTVGLDAVLRARIWNYFVELATEKLLTIIITTHYIEEAGQAHYIGLMRNGRMLAERPPRELLSQYNRSNLEDVFFILSKQQHDLEQQLFNETTPVLENNGENSMTCSLSSTMDECLHDTSSVSSAPANYAETESVYLYQSSVKGRMKALLAKAAYHVLRDVSGMVFMLGFPVLQIFAFYYGIGRQPWGLNLAIVNDELGNLKTCGDFQAEIINNSSDFSCSVKGLSCLYLSYIDDITAPKIFYTNKEDAMHAVRKGEVAGLLYFHQNYSEELKHRFDEGRLASNETVLNSELQVHLDMSNQQIALSLTQMLTTAYAVFVEKVLNDCDLNPRVAKFPLQVKDPVFGTGEETYIKFMAPAIIMSLSFFLALTLTGTIIIAERHEGVWDRSIVAGVSFTEIVISLMMVHACCMIIQVAIVILLTFYLLEVTCHGDICTMIVLVGLQGFSGMCFGFLTSTICETLTTAMYFALGSFYPYIFLNGLLWPLEGMPRFLYWIAACLPGTIPITSLRNILDRGWSIADPNVYNGFIISIFWIILEATVCVFTLKRKHK